MPFHQDANDDVRVFAQIAEAIYQRSLKLPESAAREAFDFVEFLEAKAARPPPKPAQSWDDLFGTLKGSKVFAGDPAEIQRKLREEWGR